MTRSSQHALIRAITPTFVTSQPGDATADVPRERNSPVILFGLMFCAAVIAGYVGTLMLTPVSYFLVGVMAVGGASAAFLAFAIPVQAVHFIRKTYLKAALALARARMSAAVEAAHTAIGSDRPEDQPATSLSDLAVIAQLRKKTDAARRDMELALGADPDNTAIISNMGVILAEAGDHDQAAEALARALAADDLQEARYNLGLVSPLVSTTEHLERLIPSRPGPSDVLGLNGMGVFHLRQGQLDLAAEWFTRTLREVDDYAPARANLGVVHFRRGRLRDSVAHLTRASRLAPDDARIASNLGVVLIVAEKSRWSQQYLERAHNLDRSNVGIRINMLAGEALEGHLENAARGLMEITRAAHHRADAWYNLGVVRLALEEDEGAASAAEEAVAEGDDSADAHTNLGAALWRLDRQAEATEHFQAAWEAEDAGPRAAVNYARAILHTRRDPDAALNILEPARNKWRSDLEVALDTATALLLSAVAHYRQDMKPGERSEFFTRLHRSHAGLEGAVRWSHVPVEAHINLALYLHLREDYVGAAARFEEAIKAAHHRMDLHHLAGTAYAMAGDQRRLTLEDGTRTLTLEGLELVRQAVPHLERACEPREAEADSFYNLGRCLYALGEYERALEVFRKGLRVEESEAMNSLAALAAARQARALQEAVKTQSLMPEGKQQNLTRKARQLMDAAVQYFRQALLQNELNPSSHGNIGLAYMLRNLEGDVEAALRHWQRMRAIAGDKLAARYSDFTQIQSLEHAARVQFDDREVACRPIRVAAQIAVPAPAPAPLRYVLEPVYERRHKQFIAFDPRLKKALALREHAAVVRQRLTRLEA